MRALPIKEELADDGDCSEYEEITVEVDGDFLLKEEESFETEEITYQVIIPSFASTPCCGKSFNPRQCGNASGVTWWPTLKLIQVAPLGDQTCD